MVVRRLKSLWVAVFSLFFTLFYNVSTAQETPGGQHHEEVKEKKSAFDANEVIFGHVLDAHEFHFFSWEGKDGQEHHATIPLPVIMYSPQRGLDVFMSSKFHHGHEIYKGYKLENGKILPVNVNGIADTSVKAYDISLSRNVVQMMIALIILVVIMIKIAGKYKKGIGTTKAPSGFQNAIEPVITFVRDDIAKPNLGHKYEKYMPYLLTTFFFILINNILGLIPGSANVTGNIAFTTVLGIIAFFVITLSANRHFWGHIFNPPGVPLGVKFILVPVEFLGVFIKPFALIIRLFANMVAGHIIIICLISLIFIFGELNKGVGWGASPIAVGFTVFIYFIEILVAFLQAYIFTMLTAVFIGLSMEGDHGDHAAEGGHH